MIIRFTGPKKGQSGKHGTSFKGLAAYLTHDAGRAQTDQRVAWTHTLNLAHDDVDSAVHEMLWTTRAAQQLKQQAGIGSGGRRLESPVKHFSLNWHPSDEPSREEMIEAVEGFVRHMGWDDRQAVLIAHNDKDYAHVHVMLNAVSPFDGRGIDTSYERVKASHWALDYERSQFRIHCEQRLKPYDEREPAPQREAWQELKDAERQNDRAEASFVDEVPAEADDPDERNAKEWSALKTHQREQREAFFTGGKTAFRKERNRIFREIRTEYRNEWTSYYDCQRRGMDTESLAEMKADIAARQKADLEERRDEACGELRERRDAEYRQLLDRQKEERAELRDRQERGLASPHLFDEAYGDSAERETDGSGAFPGERVNAWFRSAAEETCHQKQEQEHAAENAREPDNAGTHVNESQRVQEGASAMGDIGLGALGAIAELSERLFDGFFGGGPPPKTPEKTSPSPGRAERDDKRAREVEKQIKAQEEEAAEAAKLHAWWKERRETRGRDRD